MSAVHQTSPIGSTRVPAVAKPRDARASKELSRRALIGAALALFAIAITIIGDYVFAFFVAVGALAAAREWHRLVGSARYGREGFVTSAAILAAVVAGYLSPALSWPLAILAAGALLAACMGATRGTPVIWSALGAFYIGVPTWSLVMLRQHAVDAQWIVFGIFIIVWTADTGAMAVGRLAGGPKLVPKLSPNKTWAGLAGGLILPGLALAGYVSVFGGSAWRGFAIGAVLAAAGHAGDLFESWVKRLTGHKDSGESIPGHGGVLDRLDSMLVVTPIAALLVMVFGVARLFGVHA